MPGRAKEMRPDDGARVDGVRDGVRVAVGTLSDGQPSEWGVLGLDRKEMPDDALGRGRRRGAEALRGQAAGQDADRHPFTQPGWTR